MKKSRLFAILAIGLLLLQLFGIDTSISVKAKSSDDRNKIEVKLVEEKDDEVAWEVTVNAAKKDSDGFETAVLFDEGLIHHDVDYEDEVEVNEETDGYTIKTPEGKDVHKIDIVTKVQDTEKALFQLRAIATEGTTEYEAKDEVEIEREESVEEQPEQSSKESTGKHDKQKDDEKTTEDKTKEKNKEKSTSNAKEETPAVDEEEEVQSAEEVEGVPHPPFAKTSRPIALSGTPPNPNWPAPGSVNLEKEASETGDYAEWEVELNVQGKNLKTSSDIVLVFDRSNSMYASRLNKAKNAAKEFVDNLLVEDSTVRIALVPFGTYADEHTEFTENSEKQNLKNAIDAIRVTGGQDGGTNIQAGLRSAQSLLSDSTADQKTIVLLSDGAPTYSFKAGSAAPFTWPGNKYDFILSNFDSTNQLGSGSDYDLPTGGWLTPNHRYTVDGHAVRTNGIPTISEAKNIMDSGIGIYSVGLEVGNDADATYVLDNSQNKGYYAGGDDDMSPIFDEIAASIGYAATNAKVTDPLGEMFDLVKDESYNGANFESSHGNVSWDDANETFTWDIGNVKEDEVYTLKYKVTLDCSKDPQADVKYPTNKTTELNYKNHNGNSATKEFPIPEVSIDKGKIDKKGYRVNVDGEPIDSNGNVVSSPAEAEQFYDEMFGDNLALGASYEVDANDVDDYQLHVGDDPTVVDLTDTICTTVWFGYVKTSELPAGKVTASYVDEAGNEIAETEDFEGNIGENYATEKKDIPGYEFVQMHDDSADPTGTFTSEEQTVIYVYKQLKGTVKLIKVDEADETKGLAGAIFIIKDADGHEVGSLETDESGEAVSEALPVGDYTLEEIEAPYGYELSADQDLTITVKKNKEVELTVTNKQLTGSISIIKVDADDNKVLLQGAAFELRNEAGEVVATGVTNQDGEYEFTDVAVGNYTLIETEAPEDYRLLNKPIEIEVTPDNLTITETIENSEQGWSIPDTGGNGALGFYALGLLLMTGAGAFVYRRRSI